MLRDESVVRAGPDTVLFREGDASDCAYYLASGEVEVTVLRDGGPVVLCRKGAGELFGEMAFLAGGVRSATVRTLTACELIPLRLAQLTSRLERTDPVVRLCVALLLNRLRWTADRPEPILSIPGLAPPASCRPVPGWSDAAARALRLEGELQRALAEGEFELHYQPIVALRPRRVVGLEALVRWRHPERGIVPPGEFLPTAEATGFIARIDAWVMDEACAALARFRTAVGDWREVPFVSVNVSAAALTDPSLAFRVAGAVGRYGLPPGALRLEVTETTLISADLGGVLADCRSLGVGIALDDFGTGYSSLSYLHQLPIDTLKLDRSFVAGCGAGPDVPPIVPAVLRLARDLGLPVVAEGIRHDGQCLALAELGADFGQGFHFSRPVPEADLPALLERLGPPAAAGGTPLAARSALASAQA